MIEKEYENLGDLDVDEANGANVPVSVFLHKGEDEHEGYWLLVADNYMPRKGVVIDTGFKIRSRNREILVGLVREHWLPLYEVALKKLRDLEQDEDGTAALYYWEMDFSYGRGSQR